MTDKELLEYAAKAAGIDSDRYFYDIDANCLWRDEGKDDESLTIFAPLNDDGDALRLAVQLGLEIAFDGDDEDGEDSSCSVGYPESEKRPCKIKYAVEFHNKDIFAATRRAIVRAAAEIGKEMK